ncbi:acid protease [Coccomyxa subellipsoidea C-169]|uniref:Acid protease n=1 Tax=Coccomyxa subellipsoidea (strain C-169) TaxID=574566 RepID=I0YSU0_COCSC|nr:acid protease [Coccomyxa subellipsoidea C-169]EIE21459.1 acid protease [Coccomyxa subellipsoidea C-169]|eukprot:XP_005646003.1 acid protease [Coccomyxa subellipsoidea C-169]
MLYYGEFYLGSPPKQFTGCFDTGSSDTWVPSVACLDPSCQTHDRFNPLQSSTFKSSANTDTPAEAVLQRTSSWGPFMITYGTGQVAGTVAADTLTVGNITVKNQGFGLVLRASTDFLDISCDGLFGLGFPQISNLQTTPAFFNMLSDGQLDQPLFSLYLNPDVTKEPAGELEFGSIDTSRYVGKLTYTPVVEKKYWTVGLSGVTVSGVDVGMEATRVVIDSGTSAILLGANDAASIHKAIPGMYLDRQSGYWVVKGGCAAVADLPPVTFVIGGTPYAMPPQLWTRPAASESSTDFSGQCVSVLIGAGMASNTILGAPFLRAFYSVYTYDMASKVAQIGFAQAADGSK